MRPRPAGPSRLKVVDAARRPANDAAPPTPKGRPNAPRLRSRHPQRPGRRRHRRRARSRRTSRVEDGASPRSARSPARGAEEIDAKGKLVTPGFVDIHTHYDGQAVWSDRLSPSSSHGVTTVVGGNCGVGFAPCRPEHRDLLVSVMEGVEDIPEVVMTEGLTWDWETYPEYLERHREAPARHRLRLPDPALGGARLCDGPARRRPRAGDRGRPARRCRRWCARRSDVGALGFATSRLVIHKTGQGDPIPTWQAAETELEAMAMALKDAGRGVLQAVFGAPGRTLRGRDRPAVAADADERAAGQLLHGAVQRATRTPGAT